MSDIVDIRHRLPRPGPGAAGRAAPKTSITLHYNGPPVALANTYASHEAWIHHFIGIARYHIEKVWGYTSTGRPIYGSGIMYHLGIIPDGTIFLMRDYDEVLWHCANESGNARSRAIHLPLGGAQNATDAQWHAFTTYCDEQIGSAPEIVSRERVFGHREWKKYTIVNGQQIEVPNSACPGDILFPRLVAWRKSAVNPVPPLPPAPMLYLRATVDASVRQGPGTSYPRVMVMPEGTTAGFDPEPTDGQTIGGVNDWFHRADQLGFTSATILEPA